jgi:translation initiation factor SUI1
LSKDRSRTLFEKHCKDGKKKFTCNGTVKEQFLYGVIIELQGDQKAEICKLLIQQGLDVREQLKVNDF